MDAAALAGRLHGQLLRLSARHAGRHFQGLRAAAAHLRRNENISNRMAKKLTRLDDTFAVLRHITEMSAEDLENELYAELNNAPIGSHCKPEGLKPQQRHHHHQRQHRVTTTTGLASSPPTAPTTTTASSTTPRTPPAWGEALVPHAEALMNQHNQKQPDGEKWARAISVAVNTPIDEDDDDLNAPLPLVRADLPLRPGPWTTGLVPHPASSPAPTTGTASRSPPLVQAPLAKAPPPTFGSVGFMAPATAPTTLGVRGASAPGQDDCATSVRTGVRGASAPGQGDCVTPSRSAGPASQAPVPAQGPPVLHGVRGAAAPGQGACATPCHNTGPVSLPRESDASDSDDENDDDQTCSSMPVPNGSMDRDIEVICYATHVLMATTLPRDDMDVVRQCLNRLRRVDAVTNNTGPFSLVTCNGYKQVRFAELINVTASNLLDAQGIDSQEHDEDDTRKTDHCWTAYDAFQLWIRCATGQG